MAKKTTFFCTECGQETSGWMGRCPGCGSWNTMIESTKVTGKTSSVALKRGTWVQSSRDEDEQPIRLDDVASESSTRFRSGLPELDRVLGGGLVPGSLVLLGGDPGIGKSTLLLQVLGALGEQQRVLYIARGIRRKSAASTATCCKSGSIRLLTTTSFARIESVMEQERPALVVVDSIQTVYVEELTAAPGSVSQVREATAGLLRLAKSLNMTILLVGHVTKEGALAGPRVLEHMVDTVLYFEGEKLQNHRILRAVKNRYGATDELGIFEMTDRGLISLSDASAVFLDGRPQHVPGSVTTVSLEGTRPMIRKFRL